MCTGLNVGTSTVRDDEKVNLIFLCHAGVLHVFPILFFLFFPSRRHDRHTNEHSSMVAFSNPAAVIPSSKLLV